MTVNLEKKKTLHKFIYLKSFGNCVEIVQTVEERPKPKRHEYETTKWQP